VPRGVAARRAAPLLLAALALLLFASVGSSAAELPTSACPPPTALPPLAPAPPPSSPPAAAATLVCVGAEAISGQTYSHWSNIASKDAEPSGKGHPAAPSATELRSEVLGFLISSEWVKGEAADLGVSVSGREVHKAFVHIRDQQFPKHGEFERFRRQTGQTVADLLFRVELNLLSQRVQKHVVAGHHSAASKERALSDFVKAFKAKWQAQTYCVASYAVADCGHVQESV
jgi:hypothetical protein